MQAHRSERGDRLGPPSSSSSVWKSREPASPNAPLSPAARASRAASDWAAAPSFCQHAQAKRENGAQSKQPAHSCAHAPEAIVATG